MAGISSTERALRQEFCTLFRRDVDDDIKSLSRAVYLRMQEDADGINEAARDVWPESEPRILSVDVASDEWADEVPALVVACERAGVNFFPDDQQHADLLSGLVLSIDATEPPNLKSAGVEQGEPEPAAPAPAGEPEPAVMTAFDEDVRSAIGDVETFDFSTAKALSSCVRDICRRLRQSSIPHGSRVLLRLRSGGGWGGGVTEQTLIRQAALNGYTIVAIQYAGLR